MSYCYRCIHKDMCTIRYEVNDEEDLDNCKHLLSILFLCDMRDKCKICNPACKYTSDIAHAKNFNRSHDAPGTYEEYDLEPIQMNFGQSTRRQEYDRSDKDDG